MVFFLLPMMVVPAVSGFIFFMIFQVDGPLNQAWRSFVGQPTSAPLADRPGARDLVA